MSTKFKPVHGEGAYRLDAGFKTHLGYIPDDEPLTYVSHVKPRGSDTRVTVRSHRGEFTVDEDRLVPKASIQIPLVVRGRIAR